MRNQSSDHEISETEFTIKSNAKSPNVASAEHSPYINIEPKANIHQSILNIQGFKIASLNVASLLKHIDELRILMNNKEIYVLAINETRLDNNIPIQLTTVQGYGWIYKHRNRSGGGVGFYLRIQSNQI